MTNIWYRIDKSDGSIAVTTYVNVFRAARAHYSNPSEVIIAKRFATPWAIYSRDDCLTPNETAETTRHIPERGKP